MQSFFELMKKRKRLGDRRYGAASFEKLSLMDSLLMAEEEALDLANYAFFFWNKIQEMKKHDAKLPRV